jgi:DNA-binding transcriptional MerR regulator
MSTNPQNKEYTPEELNNIQDLVDILTRIDKELKEEGIPVDEIEALLKTDEFLID